MRGGRWLALAGVTVLSHGSVSIAGDVDVSGADAVGNIDASGAQADGDTGSSFVGAADGGGGGGGRGGRVRINSAAASCAGASPAALCTVAPLRE